MGKYQVTVDAPKNFKVMEFDNFNTAVKIAVKYKEYAFARGLHWTISFFTDKHLDAQITT
jgi:hypothetical protein